MSESGEIKKVDTAIIEDITSTCVHAKGGFAPTEIVRYVEQLGYTYGDQKELAHYAKVQITRQYIGKLKDKSGKRKYISTRQMSLDFDEKLYCKAETVIQGADTTKYSLDWLRKHMVGLIRRCPLIPDWGVAKIINVINEVFIEMKRAA